jgi:leader peptidase (prepilin peptidase)/N-methyltransferase
MIIQSAFFIFLTGLIFGSFATVLSYRIPLNKDFLTSRSKCIHCNHKLGVLQLFPVLSFLWQKGRCKFCHAKIPFRYPAIEIICGLIFLAIFFKNGISYENIIIYLTFFTLFVASLIDIKTYEVPIKIQLILLSFAGIYSIQNSLSVEEFLINPLFIYFCGIALKYSFYFFRNKDGLGLADINLAFIVTIFIGIENFVYFMFLSGLLGLIFGLIWQRIFKQNLFPFFPSLSIAFLICYGIL